MQIIITPNYNLNDHRKVRHTAVQKALEHYTHLTYHPATADVRSLGCYHSAKTDNIYNITINKTNKDNFNLKGYINTPDKINRKEVSARDATLEGLVKLIYEYETNK